MYILRYRAVELLEYPGNFSYRVEEQWKPFTWWPFWTHRDYSYADSWDDAVLRATHYGENELIHRAAYKRDRRIGIWRP
jgi:hypothetical protein